MIFIHSAHKLSNQVLLMNCTLNVEFDKFDSRTMKEAAHTHGHTWRMRYVLVFWPTAINGARAT